MSALTYLKSAKSAPSGVQPKLLLAAARNRIHDGIRALSGSTLNFVARHLYILSKYTPQQFALDFPNIYVTATTVVQIANSYQIDKASIEYGGASYPVYFGGARTFTVGAGAVNVLTDLISRAALSIPANADGQFMWVRIEGRVLAAGSIPIGGDTTDAGVYSREYNSSVTTVVNGADGVGPFTFSGTQPGVSNSQQFCMPVVVGYYDSGVQTTIKAVGGFGDSITMGTHDTYASAGPVGPSWFGRGVHDAGALINVLPSMNFGRSGAFAITYNTAGNPLTNYFGYCTIATERFGVNDFSVPATSGVTNAAQMYAASKLLWDILKQKGCKIIRIGITPKVSSTDSYATLANQTTSGGVWNQGGAVQAANALFAAGAGVDFDYYMPTTLRDPTEDAKWQVNGTANYATDDGTHPFNAANEREAVPFRALLNSINL